ncbi:MAG TPA: hypothetical protein VM491_14885, partial [Burkholderiaceae bacterium]|nr:hypothetical protein [Burkholderiaceae bacterium]
LTLAIAAGAWLAGNAVWVATWSLAAATPWWAAFLVLTIAGERLELTRLRPASPRARRAFVLLIAGWLAAPAALTAAALGALPVPPESGWRALGAIAVATAAWGLTNDIARHTIRGQGLTRYIAVCLLSGYGWLAASGAIWLTASHPGAGLSADAALHPLMLGFVFSMVFAHAPVILPAVTTVPIVFHRGLYLPLAGLHLSLTVRIGGGVAGDAALRAAGAAANAVTVALFVAAVAAGVALARSASASSRR